MRQLNIMWLDVDDFCQYMTAVRHAQASTLRISISGLRSFESFTQGVGLTNENFELFIKNSLNAAQTPEKLKSVKNTLDNKITLFNSIIEYFNYRNIPHTLKKVKHFKKDRGGTVPLSMETIRKLLDTTIEYGDFRGVSGEQLNQTYKLFTLFLTMTGGRFEESSLLKVADIDSEGQRVWFRKTKSGKARPVNITEPLFSQLTTHCKGKEPSELVFTNLVGKTIDRTKYSNDLKMRAEIIGLKRIIHPHLLRHSYAGDLIDNRVSLEKIGRLMGHTSIQTTYENYMHLKDSALREAVERHSFAQENIPGEKIVDQIVEEIHTKLKGNPKIDYVKVLKAVQLLYASIKNDN